MCIKTCCSCILPWFGGLYCLKDHLVTCYPNSSPEHPMPPHCVTGPPKRWQDCLQISLAVFPGCFFHVLDLTGSLSHIQLEDNQAFRAWRGHSSGKREVGKHFRSKSCCCHCYHCLCILKVQSGWQPLCQQAVTVASARCETGQQMLLIPLMWTWVPPQPALRRQIVSQHP